VIVFPRVCLIGFNYAQPFLISSAIDYISQPTGDRNTGYGLIAATALIYLGIAVSAGSCSLPQIAESIQVSTAHYQHRVSRMVTAFRGGMVTLIFARTLKMQAGFYDESAALTLMSTDLDRLTSSLQALNEIWARVIEISIGLWLLERQLGWVCVAPIFFVVGKLSDGTTLVFDSFENHAQLLRHF
jgi:ATP-binding cassette subfamily C (CFTR/MRP) protein 1